MSRGRGERTSHIFTGETRMVHSGRTPVSSKRTAISGLLSVSAHESIPAG